MVCPEIQLSDTRGVSVRMCLGGYVWVRLTFESVDWGKQIDCLLQSGNASSNPWRVWRGQEAGKREFALSAWASSSWELVSSCFQIQIGTYTIGFPGSQGFKLRLKLSSVLLGLGLLTVDLGLLRLPNHVSQFLIVNMYVVSYWFCFFGEARLIYKDYLKWSK